MQRTQLITLTLTLGTVVLAVAGCGSSKSNTGTTANGTLTKTELIAKADAICARVHAEYHANGYTTTASIAKLAPKVAGYEEAGAHEMRELKAPPSLVSSWNAILDNTEEVAEDTDKLGQYAKENNMKAATSLFTADSKKEQSVLAAAARDGFKECARQS